MYSLIFTNVTLECLFPLWINFMCFLKNIFLRSHTHKWCTWFLHEQILYGSLKNLFLLFYNHKCCTEMTKFLHEQILCVSLNFKLHFCVNLESKISHGMKPSGSHGPCRSHGVLVHFENDILFNFIRSILINVLQSDDQHLSDQTITSNLYFREFFKNDSKTCLLPFEVKSSLNPIFLSA